MRAFVSQGALCRQIQEPGQCPSVSWVLISGQKFPVKWTKVFPPPRLFLLYVCVKGISELWSFIVSTQETAAVKTLWLWYRCDCWIFPRVSCLLSIIRNLRSVGRRRRNLIRNSCPLIVQMSAWLSLSPSWFPCAICQPATLERSKRKQAKNPGWNKKRYFQPFFVKTIRNKWDAFFFFFSSVR